MYERRAFNLIQPTRLDQSWRAKHKKFLTTKNTKGAKRDKLRRL